MSRCGAGEPGGEPGIALLIVVMAMSLLLALGLALTSVTIGETGLAAAYGQSSQVFYAAESVAAYALQSLARQPWPPVLDGQAIASLHDAAVLPAVADDVPPGRLFAYGWLHDLLPPGTVVPRVAVAAWVAAEADGNRLVVTARAFGVNGSRRTIELRVVHADLPQDRLRVVSWREVR